MPLSTAEKTQVFDHIFTTLLGHDAQSTDYQVMLGCGYLHDLESLFELTRDDLVNLECKIGTNRNTTKLKLPFVHSVLAFIDYYTNRSPDPSPPLLSLSNTATADSFETYRRTIYRVKYMSASFNPGASLSSRNQMTPAQEFQKGNKRDPTAYREFTQDSQWDSWRRHVISTAQTHETGIVLTDYNPIKGSNNAEKFDKQKLFMYNVFVNTVHTLKGQQVVRRHETEMDGQAVWHDLKEYYMNSIQAQLNSRDIYTAIVTSRFGGNGKSAAKFYQYFNDLFRKYNAFPDVEDISDFQQMLFLKAAFQPVPELHSVETTAQAVAQGLQKELTLDIYKTQLETAITNYDRSLQHKSSPTRASRSAHQHTQFPDQTDPHGEDTLNDGNLYAFNTELQIDDPLDRFLVYANESRYPAGHVPKDTYGKLSSATKALLRQISATDKALLFPKQGDTQQHSTTSTRLPPRPAFGALRDRATNLHDMTIGEYIALQHDLSRLNLGNTQVTPTATATLNAPTETSTLTSAEATPARQANTHFVTQQEPTKSDHKQTYSLHPASVKQFLSKDTQGKPTITIGGKEYTANVHDITYQQKNSAIQHPPTILPLTIIGMVSSLSETLIHFIMKLFRLAQSTYTVMAMPITYSVRPAYRGMVGALMDRGANGPVLGADGLVFERCPNIPPITIEGYDNHQRTGIPIVIAAYLVSTNIGPAIILIPHSAHHGKGSSIISPGYLESFGSKIDDTSVKVGGTQTWTLPHGVKIPMDMVNGLPRIPVRPPSPKELDECPHIWVGNPEMEWDPRALDSTLTESTPWFEQNPPVSISNNPNFGSQGEYLNRSVDVHELERPTDHDDLALFDFEQFSCDTQAHKTLDAYEPLDSVLDNLAEYHYIVKHHSLLSSLKGIPEHGIQSSKQAVKYLRMEHQSKAFEKAAMEIHSLLRNNGELPRNGSRNTRRSARLNPNSPSTAISDATTSTIGEEPRTRPDGEPPPTILPDTLTEDKLDAPDGTSYTSSPIPRIQQPKERDWSILRPMFGWLNSDIIKQTFQRSTQMARMPQSELLRKHYKAPNPALNVFRRNEDVATDTFYSDTPSVDGGETCAQFFCGLTTHVCNVYPMSSPKQFVNTLEDIIRERGAMNRLISDSAAVETSARVKDILRALYIDAWQSEPHQQHQNPAERRYQTVKTAINRVLDRTGAPPDTWLLCAQYVCYLLNHTYNNTVKDIPINCLTGSTTDISALLRFHFWQEVYYKLDDGNFPSDSPEQKGNIVGIAEHVGHYLTYKVLTQDSRRVLHRANLRPATSEAPNKRMDLLSGEDLPPTPAVVKTRVETIDKDEGFTTISKQSHTPVAFNPADLIGRSFLLKESEDGQRHRARIVECISKHDADIENNPHRIKFRVSVNNDEYEEILAYNEVMNYILPEDDNEVLWKYKQILSHQGPLKPDDPNYMGSKWNIKMEWENGETTYEPLAVIAKDDPVACAIYAKDNNLLHIDGWKRFKSIAGRHKKYIRMVKAAKLQSYKRSKKYMFGYEIPINYKDAVRLDNTNGNTRWQDATALEMVQLTEYDTFHDLGNAKTASIPEGFKRIRVHLVYACKHDGRFKARLVADGHLTDIPSESVYSGVVSLRAFRVVLFLSQLNGLEMWATDVGSAYLEAKTKERLVIVAGPEFKELAGHLLRINKALYGLRTSGKRWHQRCSEVLRDMGFKPCRAEPDVWMRPNGNVYEYIAVYVDDFALAMKDPGAFCDTLMKKYNFKLKGTGEIKYHLGMDFHRDPDGILTYAPKKYIEKMVHTYTRLFGETPPTRQVTSPLEQGDHPECDTSELLDDEGISKYQSIIGSLQWAITIGRLDIATAVMSLSSFRAAPRRGHLDRAKRVVCYLTRFDKAAIRIKTQMPDFTGVVNVKHDWESIYGNLSEVRPTDAPKPLGKPVVTASYVDANLMHDLLTGRSVTGILHFLNKTPIDWFSKKQNTVETSTYGSEFVAARTCVEQIIELRMTLMYLGVPVHDSSYMFGDNESVVNSSIDPTSRLHKRHSMLSFHRVREAVASGMVIFDHLPGAENCADILTKHWSHAQIWNVLKPVLFQDDKS